ncbi:MAG: TolB-like protein [Candidatus Azotimanducaceae bacterium]|jgi:TolB-like protein
MFKIDRLTVIPEKNQLLDEAEDSTILSRRTMDLLVYFSKHQNEVLSNDQLMKDVWVNRVVSDSAIYKAISEIRTALGDSNRPYKYLKTVPKRGYEFVAEVIELEARFPKLLVYPFKSEDADSLVITYGLTEDIVAGLSASKWMMVFDSGTSFSFSGTGADPREAAKQLKATYVVHGRLRRNKDQLRANFYLTDVNSGESIWSEQFDRAADEVFDMEDEIKHHLLAAIEPEYLRNEERIVKSKETNLQVWEQIMKARQVFWRTEKKTNFAARALVQEVIESSKEDVRAWGLLAMTHLNDAWNGWSDSIGKSLALADRASKEAIRVDESDPWAHHTRSAVTGTMGDLSQAEADLRRALTLNPHFASALGDMARIKVFSGDTEGAEDYALSAMDLSPRDPHFGLWCYWIALIHFVEAQYDSALPWLDKGNAIRPDWVIFDRLKAVCFSYLGKENLVGRTLANIDVEMTPEFLLMLKVSHPFSNDEPFVRYVQGLKNAVQSVS